MVQSWFSLNTDRGAVLWAILCCWSGVLLSCTLISSEAPIEYVVPMILFGTPAVVTLALWLLGRIYQPRRF
jgi:hypothetical protein